MQSVIVYRNPAEAALWESGLIGPLMISLLAFVLFVYIVGGAINNMRKIKPNVRDWYFRAMWVGAAASTFAVFHYSAKALGL